MRVALAVLLGLAGPAAGQTLPSLNRVTGVADGDVLNIRAAPDAGSSVIGRFAPDAGGIEVVAQDGGWGRVNAGGRAGWVALRYLAPEPGTWAPGTLPAGLACFGTEPFWSLRPQGGKAVFDTPDGGEGEYDLMVLDAGIPADPRRALIAVGGGRRLTGSVTPGACSDQMSDRAYGLGITLIVEDGGTARMLTGCCSIAP